jgi:hypothetical protein
MLKRAGPSGKRSNGFGRLAWHRPSNGGKVQKSFAGTCCRTCFIAQGPNQGGGGRWRQRLARFQARLAALRDDLRTAVQGRLPRTFRPEPYFAPSIRFGMSQLANDWRFLRTFLAKPLRVASPVPSGPRLAEAIAAQVEPNDDPILELGPGTGAVTEAILERGVTPSQLVAVESDPDFAQLLRQRFKQSKILDGDAFALQHVLRGAGWDQPFAPSYAAFRS